MYRGLNALKAAGPYRLRLYMPIPPRQQNHISKQGPIANPTLLVAYLCTLYKSTRSATEIITTISAEILDRIRG
jgi:hypothetical protein